MGIQNTAMKNYMSRNDIFVELVNYYVFHGKKVLKPEDLKEADSAESILLQDGQGKAVERYRDILKQGILKLAAQTGFLFIGVENQTAVHYAMPVRSMLYDALTYTRQISGIENKHRQNQDSMLGSEFLSGLKEEDRLIPVITLVVYLGQEPWTAPCSLHGMLQVTDVDILDCVADYSINLIDPHQMAEEDYQSLGDSLQYVMRFIGASGSREAMEKLLHDFKEQYTHMERDAAELLKACTKTKLEIEENKEEIDMCKAWDDMQKECLEKGKVAGKEEGLREGMKVGKEAGKAEACHQMKEAVAEIVKGCNTVELLLEKGFSKSMAEDAIEIARQFAV